MGCQLVFNAWYCLMQHLVNWSHEVFSGLLVPFAYYTLQSLMWLQHWSGGGVSPAPPMEFTCDWVGVALHCTRMSDCSAQCANGAWNPETSVQIDSMEIGSANHDPTPTGDPMTLYMGDHYIPISCIACNWVDSCAVCATSSALSDIATCSLVG